MQAERRSSGITLLFL